MVFTDYSKIKDITFKYPSLMSDTAKKEIIDLFNSLHKDQERVYELREEISNLEKQIELNRGKIDEISPLIDITYDSIEKEYHTNISTVGFNMSSEINKGLH